MEDQVELPDGEVGDYIWLAGRRGSITVLARDLEGRLLVEREYSYLPDEPVYQWVGGGIEAGETPLAAAARELTEEAKLAAGKMTPIGTIVLNHRLSAARNHVFLAEELTPCEALTHDKYEAGLETFWMTEAEIETLIAQGEVIIASMLAVWALYKAAPQRSS